jgi:ferritin-like metal-binding protein YciE
MVTRLKGTEEKEWRLNYIGHERLMAICRQWQEIIVKSMDDLFHNVLQDVYYAEKQLLRTLPKLARRSSNAELEKALNHHRDETENQVQRLEQVFDMIGKKPRGKKCDAMLGIIAEGDEVMSETDGHAIRDAGIIAAAQAAEHYEIARYGTLCVWAEALGKRDAAGLLKETLEEEKKADQLLTSIAKGQVNQAAISQAASGRREAETLLVP